MDNERIAQLEQLAGAVENLTESPLYEYRRENGYHAVIGEGSPNASIMFIGEAPGEQEAKAGRPFVGAAGRVLNDLLESVGLRREDVYITNILKDRPPNNRDPRPDEVRLYAPFLQQQIEIIRPSVIVTLGRFSMDFILTLFDMPEQGQKIGALHGRVLEANNERGHLAVIPLYHPAVAFYRQDQRETLWQDFQALKPFI
ncbi:MAG: uracil-DNA glycosylase [Chloroflexi bacterium]|nr:uracil-DNA glycosylase [Chloroflexota bacterium]